MRLPGLGPKTAARIWRELGRHDARGAEGRRRRPSGCARWPGSARSRRRRSSRRSPSRRRTPTPAGACSATACPPCRRRSPTLREHPAAVRVSEAGSVRRRKETFRDLDLIATATDPGELTAFFVQLPWVRRRRRARRHEGDGRLERGPPLRPPRRAARVVREPAPALHRLEGAQRRDARGRGAPRPLHLRVRRDDGRDRRGVPHRGRGRALRVPRLPADRAGAARELRRAGGGASRRAAARSSSCRSSAATCTRTRTGRRTGRTRSRRWSPRRRRAATSTTRSPTTRTTCGRDASPRSSRRSSACASSSRSCASSPASRRTSARTATSTCPEDELARLDWVVASVHQAQREPADRARARGDGQPVRRLHRPPHRPPDRHARPARRRRRARRREGARDGRVPRDQRPARPARPARRARARGEGGRAEARRLVRRAPDPRAELRRAGDRRRRGAAG